MECINPHCRHYSDKARKLYDESQRHPAEKPQEEFKFEDEDTNPHWPFVLD